MYTWGIFFTVSLWALLGFPIHNTRHWLATNFISSLLCWSGISQNITIRRFGWYSPLAWWHSQDIFYVCFTWSIAWVWILGSTMKNLRSGGQAQWYKTRFRLSRWGGRSFWPAVRRLCTPSIMFLFHDTHAVEASPLGINFASLTLDTSLYVDEHWNMVNLNSHVTHSFIFLLISLVALIFVWHVPHFLSSLKYQPDWWALNERNRSLAITH